MKNVIKIVSILIIATIILNITSVITLAKDTENGQATLSVNISKDFKKWTELSDEERKNSIMPAVSTSTLSEIEKKDANSIWGNVKNFFARASIPSKYSLKDYINIPVKNQGITGECWAFSMTSVLESYLAKSGQMTVIPRYSARHMDYATSKTFLDGTNPIAYNRELGDGGNFGVAFGYLTNGTGAVLEKDMPFENNENKINLSEIQKQPQMRVTDYQLFPNINKTFDSSGNVTYTDDMGEEYTKDEVNQIRNEIKQFIMKYGGITVNTYSRGLQYYSNPSQYDKSVAYFCNDNDYAIDHEITIVGWDDNYSVDNFNPEHKPKNPGAYLCLNSWGTDYFDDGYLYISYDDVNIEKSLAGIMGAEEITEDQNIYQNDFYGETMYINLNPGGDVGLANVFTKEGNADEYIEEVQVAAKGSDAKAEVYINPTDDSLDSSKLQKVDIESNDLDAEVNTLKLKKPIKITGNKFTVVVKLIYSEPMHFGIEANLLDCGASYLPTMFDCVTASPGESYISTDSLQSWHDFTTLRVGSYTFEQANLCVKAITTTDAPEEDPNTNTGNENTNTGNENTNTNTGNENTNTNTGNENTNTNTGNENTNTNTGNENTNTNTNTGNENTNTNTGNENTNTNTGNENTNTNTGNENTNTNTGNENTNTNTGNENTNTNTGNENTNTNTGNENTNTNTGNENTNTNTGNENTNTNTGNENTNTNTGNENTNTNTGNENTNTNTGNENTNTNTGNDNTNTNMGNENTNTNNSNNNYNSGIGTTNNNDLGNNSVYYYNGTVDKSLSDTLLPKTGTELVVSYILPIGFIILIISYVNYRRFRDVK